MKTILTAKFCRRNANISKQSTIYNIKLSNSNQQLKTCFLGIQNSQKLYKKFKEYLQLFSTSIALVLVEKSVQYKKKLIKKIKY